MGCNPKLAGRTRATQVANHIQPGGWVGELEFLQGAEREASTTTSVMALEPVSYLSFNIEALDRSAPARPPESGGSAPALRAPNNPLAPRSRRRICAWFSE